MNATERTLHVAGALCAHATNQYNETHDDANHPLLKFSADYDKLPPNWDGTLARLKYVHSIKLQEQTPAFLRYDVTGRPNPSVHYPLPASGDYLLLLFRHGSGAYFTTLRRDTPTKGCWYARQLNKDFKLVRVEQ